MSGNVLLYTELLTALLLGNDTHSGSLEQATPQDKLQNR